MNAANCLRYLPLLENASKESWPRGPGFDLPLKGAAFLQIEQVQSALSELKCLKLWSRFAPLILYNWQNSLTLVHFKLLHASLGRAGEL